MWTKVSGRLSGLLGDRGRNIAVVGSWSLLARLASALNIFASIPLAFGALGAELFGAWVTLVALSGAAGMLDFGFGNGALNLIAAARGQENAGRIDRVIRESYRSILVIVLALGLIFAVALATIPWCRLLGLPAGLDASARAAVAVMMIAVLFAIPLSLANRIQLGLGLGNRAFRWQILGTLLSLASLATVSNLGGSLWQLVAAAVVTPLLASAANTASLLRQRRVVWSTSQSGDSQVAAEIRREGILFFVLQIAALAAFSSDLPIISALLGAEEAGRYAVAQRLFSIVPMALSLVWVPLWPIYRHALAAGDHLWVSRTLKHSIAFAITCALGGGGVLALAFDFVTPLWLGHTIVAGSTLVFGLLVWTCVEAVGNAVATFLNAASLVRYQVVTAILFGIVCFVGKVCIVAKYGLELAPWVTTVSYIVASLLPTIVMGRRLLSTAFSKQY